MLKPLLISFLICLSLSISSNASAQLTDSTDLSQLKPNRTSFRSFLPGALALTYGVIALGDNPLKDLDLDIRNRRNEKRYSFNTHADDYLRYVPYLTVMAFEVIGIKGKSELKDKAGLMLGSAAIAYGSAYVIKNIADKRRPNNKDNKSFPSGHATIAFAGAEMLNQEYGESSPWISIAAYTVASATSVLRVYNNDHWFSDVVAGAGVGILSTKLTYLVYPSIKKMISGKNNSQNFAIYPAYQQQTLGFTLISKY